MPDSPLTTCEKLKRGAIRLTDRHFTVKSIHNMMESNAFAAAAMAFASRQIDNAGGAGPNPLTLELYQ
jgi:hypothetical protein